MLIIVFFRALLDAIRSMILNHFSIKADLRLIYSYLSHILKLPLSFYDSRKTGEILSRIDDAQNVRAALSQASISIVMDTLMLIIVGAFLYMTNSSFFFIVLATVPLSSIVVWGLLILLQETIQKGEGRERRCPVISRRDGPWHVDRKGDECPGARVLGI